jgi:hypothetical protein
MRPAFSRFLCTDITLDFVLTLDLFLPSWIKIKAKVRTRIRRGVPGVFFFKIGGRLGIAAEMELGREFWA